jgi:hypothetical protein
MFTVRKEKCTHCDGEGESIREKDRLVSVNLKLARTDVDI